MYMYLYTYTMESLPAEDTLYDFKYRRFKVQAVGTESGLGAV
jgi:hypothetical protein